MIYVTLKHPTATPRSLSSPAALLKLAGEVYKGLTEEEIDEVEAIACHRSDWRYNGGTIDRMIDAEKS